MLIAGCWFLIGIFLGALFCRSVGWLRVLVFLCVVLPAGAANWTFTLHNGTTNTIACAVYRWYPGGGTWELLANQQTAPGGSVSGSADPYYNKARGVADISNSKIVDPAVSGGDYHWTWTGTAWEEGTGAPPSYIWYGCITNNTSVAELYSVGVSAGNPPMSRVLSPGEYWCVSVTNASPFQAGFQKIVFGPEGGITQQVSSPTWAGTNTPAGGGGGDSGGNQGSNTGDDLTADLMGQLLKEVQRARTNLDVIRTDVGDLGVDMSGIENNTDALEGLVSDVENAVDGLESNTGTANGLLQDIKSNTGSTASSTASVNTNVTGLRELMDARLLSLQSNTLWGLEHQNTNLSAGLSSINTNLTGGFSNAMWLATNDQGFATNTDFKAGIVSAHSNALFESQAEIYAGASSALSAPANPGAQADFWHIPIKTGLGAGAEDHWDMNPRQLSWWAPVGSWVRYALVWTTALLAVFYIYGYYQGRLEVLFAVPGGNPLKSVGTAIGWTISFSTCFGAILLFPLALAGLWSGLQALGSAGGGGVASPFAASVIASTCGTGRLGIGMNEMYSLALNFIPFDGILSIGLYVLGAVFAADRLLAVGAIKTKMLGA